MSEGNPQQRAAENVTFHTARTLKFVARLEPTVSIGGRRGNRADWEKIQKTKISVFSFLPAPVGRCGHRKQTVDWALNTNS